jgi:hypothetical protein
VSTPPGAAVIVDEKIVGRTPFVLTGPSDKPVRVTLQLDGFASLSDTAMPTAEGGDADFALKPIAFSKSPSNHHSSPPTHRHHEAAPPPAPAPSAPTEPQQHDPNGLADPYGK